MLTFVNPVMAINIANLLPELNLKINKTCSGLVLVEHTEGNIKEKL